MADPLARFLRNLVEELVKGGCCAVFSHPEQPPAFVVNLVNDRPEFSFGAQMHLVKAQRFNGSPNPVLESKGDGRFHRSSHRIPGDMEDLPNLLPGQPPSPPGQPHLEGQGVGMFAAGPGQIFGEDPVFGTVHPASRVVEENLQTPQGNELKGPPGQLIVAWTGLAAFPTTGLAAFSWANDDIDGCFSLRIPEDLVVNKALEMAGPVQ